MADQTQEQLNHIREELESLQTRFRSVQENKEKSMIASIPPPDRFTFRTNHWSGWLKAYERFRFATGLNNQEEKVQINYLLLHMGSQVDNLLMKLHKTESDFRSYKQRIETLNIYYSQNINVIFERAKFNKRDQRASETAEEYISEIIRLAENCRYRELKDELVRDRLVVGIKDQQMSG